MKCGNQDCKSENRIAIGFCPKCMEERTCSSFQGHPDQTFGHLTYSQTGEDIIVCNIFEKILGIPRPSYLDLGAYHPLNISNTALLYKRGSRGVNVEANCNLIPEFFKYRPDDTNLCCAIVTNPNQKTAFLHMYDWGSGRNSIVKGYLESDPYGPLPEKEKMEIAASTVNEIVLQFCEGVFPNFMSVDIEGMDYDVIQSCDFKKYGYPHVICVEVMSYREPGKIIELLYEKGFLPLIRLSINIIFVRKDIHSMVTT
jgi:Methyltransferase FkbM domain